MSSIGTITGFGSVFISGVKYEVEAGTIVAIEGEEETQGDDSALRLAMKVEVSASETGDVRTANRIRFDNDLKGAVENVQPDAGDPTTGTFRIAGQTVLIDAETVFDNDVGNNDGLAGIDIRDLDASVLAGNQPMVVEVSGFPTETGILATRIDRRDEAATDIGRSNVDGDEIEVKGFVDSVAADGNSFTVNDAVFRVNAATQFDEDLGANSDLIGKFVEVKADIDAAGDFIARRVEREDDFGDDDRSGEFEIEGILQSVDTAGDPDVIVVNGVRLEVSDAAQLVQSIGQRIEVKGSFNDNGVVQIRQAGLDPENTVRIEDRVASLDAAGGVITTRLGVVVEPTGASRIRDKAGDDGDRLSVDAFLARVSPGDFLEARGVPAGESGVTWTRIEREDEDDQECKLRGPVSEGSIADPGFTILDVAIDTTGLGFGGFEDENDLDIGRAAFFQRLAAGNVVQAKSGDDGSGCASGRLVTGTDGEVEFEPEDGIAGNGGGDGGATGGAEIAGAVRSLDAGAGTFTVAQRTITVTDDTLIDASIVEKARGVELGDADLRFGDLPETLDQLLSNGDLVKVRIDANDFALQIEDDE